MDNKISALNPATVLTDADVLPIVNGAETKKVSIATIKAQTNVNADWNATTGVAQILNKPTIPTETSVLTNDGADGINPFITALDVPIYGQAGTLVREVRNTTGATLIKGTVVYINGASGNKPTVAKALATSDALSARTFGLLQSDILHNGNGYCVVVGDLSGLNTSAFTEGVQLYLSGTVAGAYTATKTLAPTHLVYVGKVTRAHPTQGQIEVQIQNGYELEEIHDVAIVTPINNNILTYESSTDLWKNKTITEVLGYTPIKSVIKDTVQGSTITGVTTEVLTGTYLIPANTFELNDMMRITSFLAEKIGVTGTCTMRVKVGITNVFTSATTIATYVTGTSDVFCALERKSITLRGGNVRYITSSRINDVLANVGAIGVTSFNPAIDNYIFTSLQLSVGTDSVFQSNFIMTN